MLVEVLDLHSGKKNSPQVEGYCGQGLQQING